MKRMICTILSACLLTTMLAGCGGEGGGKTDAPMGRYVEERGETLEKVDRVYGFAQAADGGLVFYGRTMAEGGPAYDRYALPNGGALVKENQDWLAAFLDGGSLRDISEAADGTVYFLYSGMDGSNAVARKAPGGTPERIPVADLDIPADGGGGMAITPGSVDVGSASPDGGTASMFVGDGVSVGDAPAVAAGKDDSVDMTLGEEAEGAAEGASEGGSAGLSVSGGKTGTYNFTGGQKFPNGVAALDDGFLIYFGGDGIYRYGTDGAKKTEYPGNAYSGNAVVFGNTLLTLSVDGSELWSYDLEAAKQNGTYTYENLGYGTRVGLDAGGVYLADSSGVYRQASGGSIWERLVDGGLTSLVMPNVSIHGLAPDGGDGFHALLDLGSEQYQLMHYTFDASVPTDPDTELTIFALRDNATVRQAIGEFQRLNANVRVNFRVAMEEGSAATAEDVIRSLNTEILGGKGPDLILLDGLPVSSYIEKGVLLDLTELVDQQVAEQGFLPNLMNAYSEDGKVYGVPSKFTVPVMMGESGEVDALRTLAELAARAEQGVTEEPPFLRAPETLWDEGGPGMLMKYYDAYAGTFVKDGAVDQAALRDYFAAMLRIDAAVKEYTPQMGGSMASMVAVSVSSGGGFEALDMGVLDMKNGQARFHITELSGFFGLRNAGDNLTALGGQKLDSLFGAKHYTPVGGVGVLASGKQQELSKSFVELLLSPTVQDSYVYDGYPVNGTSLDKLVAEMLDGTDDMGFAALCRTLDAPILVDQVVKEAAQAQAKGLLDGSLTPEQAAANVAEKTALYLAE